MSRPVRIAETPPRVPLKVLGVRPVGPGVFCLRLEKHPQAWVPGDCVTLFAPGSVSGRPYSFSGSPNDPFSEFWIRAVPGGEVSSFLCACAPGDVVEASPPFGWFRPLEPLNVPRLFVATGTGITPFLSALRYEPEVKDVRVLWGMREALEVPECLQDVETERWVSRHEVAGTKRGRVTEWFDAFPLPPDTHVYLCGLDAMIEEVSALLSDRGVPGDRIHREVFFTGSAPS